MSMNFLDPFIFPEVIDGENKLSPLCNRIRKNYKHLRKWGKRTETNCFRIYDRDIKEYPIAIDFYAGFFCVHYYLQKKENDEPSLELLEQTSYALSALFGASSDDIYWRARFKRKKCEQYEKNQNKNHFFTVHEYGVKFKVNLEDYLDTGLFLDHRETRQLVAKQAEGKKLLNLFAYTGSFSVHAACKGAAYTKSVDLSNRYCDWAKENFLLNALSLETNQVVREDCLKFLDHEIFSKLKYDLIIIDPPTISRSKKMEDLFDIQIDYVELIHKALRLLEKNGKIFFSTNSRKFKFDQAHFQGNICKEISQKTIPLDFHDQKIHRCWEIF